ncbi:hypothetical protein KP509_21G024500 [Ceratopteris richardii]|uniref:Uncharacterized protein n=1 Tax=Ceratopteris richardii TaxID=49495 RepID=A0A8T2S875_CERRI|nr:hypothetical protein KP509_21G024500 [Ceratopteris richardii]
MFLGNFCKALKRLSTQITVVFGSFLSGLKTLLLRIRLHASSGNFEACIRPELEGPSPCYGEDGVSFRTEAGVITSYDATLPSYLSRS